MKKYFVYILAAVAIALGLTACHKVAEYEPGQPDVEGCYGVYFPSQEATGAHTFDPTMTPEIEFTVVRSNSKGAIEVPLVVSDPEGVFELEPLKFEDGQSETMLKVKFPNADLGVAYPLSIAIKDPVYASRYNTGAVSLDFSVLRVEWKYFLDPKTGEPAVIRYTEGWNELEHTGKLKYYEVGNLRTCVIEPDPYVEDGVSYPGFWASGEKYTLNFFWYLDTSVTGEDGELYQALHAPVQPVQYHTKYSAEVNLYDNYSFYTVLNPTDPFTSLDFKSFAGKYSDKIPCSYYDGNGGFHFYTAYYYMPGQGGWSTNLYDTVLLADGFTRVDYSIKAELDYSVEGVLPVYFEVGADVKEIRFAGFEGELSKNGTEKAVESITSSEEGLNIVTVSEDDIYEYGEAYYADSAISFEKTGTYTIVAVTYDAKGEVQNYTSVAGPFVAEGDIEENAVNISVGTETTSERYAPDSDASNSFGFWISGEDIKAVNYTVVPTASFEKNADAILNGVKYGAEGSVALEDSEIEEVNAVGGYTQLVSGLDALTSYTLVVWATNGVSDTFVTDGYTTEGLPNEIIADGTFSYVYTIYNTNYDPSTEEEWDRIVDGMSLEYNPNTDCYEIPEWYGDVTLVFKYDKESGEISVPMQGIEDLSAYGYGVAFVTDPSALPQSWIDEIGIDLTQKSYVDEDGVFHFYVSYATTKGAYFDTNYEYFGPTEAFVAEAEAAPAAPGQRNFRKFEGFGNLDCSFGLKFSDYERDPQPVAIKVVNAPRRTFGTGASLRGSERTVEVRKF